MFTVHSTARIGAVRIQDKSGHDLATIVPFEPSWRERQHDPYDSLPVGLRIIALECEIMAERTFGPDDAA